MKTLLAILALAISFGASAQSSTDYLKLKSAGKVTLAVGTKQAPDPKDASKQISVADPDTIVSTVPVFDAQTGAQVGTASPQYSITAEVAKRAALAKALADQDALVADLKAAK